MISEPVWSIIDIQTTFHYATSAKSLRYCHDSFSSVSIGNSDFHSFKVYRIPAIDKLRLYRIRYNFYSLWCSTVMIQFHTTASTWQHLTSEINIMFSCLQIHKRRIGCFPAISIAGKHLVIVTFCYISLNETVILCSQLQLIIAIFCHLIFVQRFRTSDFYFLLIFRKFAA